MWCIWRLRQGCHAFDPGAGRGNLGQMLGRELQKAVCGRQGPGTENSEDKGKGMDQMQMGNGYGERNRKRLAPAPARN